MKKLVLTLAVAGLAAAGYFYLDLRRTALIEKEQSNNQLRIDNPSERDLLLLLDHDSIEVPARSVVFYPVNDLKLAKAPVRIRSFESATKKLIADSTLLLSESLFDYFLNPSLSRYISYSQTSMVLAGYQVDQNLQAQGSKMRIVQDFGSPGDTVFISSLRVNCKGCTGVFNPEIKEENTELKSHSETKTYLLRTSEQKPQEIFYSEKWDGWWNVKRVIVKE